MPEDEIVSIFNNSKYCYFYDTQTYYSVIAAVCGCIPIIVLEPNKSISDYLSPNERHLGRAYGDSSEQLQYAIDTRDQLIKSLDYREHNEENITKFISLVSSSFC